jgi:acyl-CoA dehydrogenase
MGNLPISSSSSPRPIPARGPRASPSSCWKPTARKGFARGKKLDKIGLDAQDTSELFFDDVFVPARTSSAEWKDAGFYQLMGELPQERLVIAMQAQSGIEHALDVTVEYVKGRKAFGQTIWDFQNTQFVLADLKAKGTAARVFVTTASPSCWKESWTWRPRAWRNTG